MSKLREQGVVRVALHEIERLLNDASRSGTVDTWVEQVAVELRTAMPELAPDAAAEFARRMLEEPRRALDAQGRIDTRSLAALKQ